MKRRRPLDQRLRAAFRDEIVRDDDFANESETSPVDERQVGEAKPARPGGRLRAALVRRRERVVRQQLVALPPGVEVAVLDGHPPAWVRRIEYPAASTQHGDWLLDDARSVAWKRIAEVGKDPEFANVDLEQCLFVDTETTGLAGGAGTVVFMVGLGYFEGAKFVLEQVFLRSFGEERAALSHVAARLAEHPVPVSFVGKSFDRHRLHARMTLHRVEAPILAPLHLDLYYCARRVWGEQLPDVKLQTVERERLGLHRDDDLPGSAAPQAYIDWIRLGTGPIDRVFEHNRLDVLTLVTLLGALGRAPA